VDIPPGGPIGGQNLPVTVAGRIAANRSRIEIELSRSSKARLLSPAVLTLHRVMAPRLQANAWGRILDVGCGVMPFRRLVEPFVTSYHAFDIEARVPNLDFLADVQSGLPLVSDSYDLILCSQVLEHVPEPAKAIAEMARVLRPRGILLLSAPFLARLHDEPFDFYRFSRHALTLLLEQHGFEEAEVVPAGSIFSFLGHQVSSVIVPSTWNIPLLRHVTFWLNALLVTLPCSMLDLIMPGRDRLPLNYVVVARLGERRRQQTSPPQPRARA
jgi:SAM-dependent methyltransferase